MTRIRRRFRYWLAGMGHQCRGRRVRPSIVRIDGEPIIGYSTIHCQKSRGHFSKHSYELAT